MNRKLKYTFYLYGEGNDEYCMSKSFKDCYFTEGCSETEALNNLLDYVLRNDFSSCRITGIKKEEIESEIK